MWFINKDHKWETEVIVNGERYETDCYTFETKREAVTVAMQHKAQLLEKPKTIVLGNIQKDGYRCRYSDKFYCVQIRVKRIF